MRRRKRRRRRRRKIVTCKECQYNHKCCFQQKTCSYHWLVGQRTLVLYRSPRMDGVETYVRKGGTCRIPMLSAGCCDSGQFLQIDMYLLPMACHHCTGAYHCHSVQEAWCTRSLILMCCQIASHRLFWLLTHSSKGFATYIPYHVKRYL